MTHRSTQHTPTLLTILLAFILVVAACSSGNQITATPAAPDQSTAAPTATSAVVDRPAMDNPALASTFVIDPSQSEAHFTVAEKLMGQPKTVMGVTQSVDGSITLDPADLTKTTLSPIRIDARAFTTDSGLRNNAIRRFILQSNKDEYRYIIFTPTVLEGLPTNGESGDTLNFQITGDLTISGVTKPVTFATTVTAESTTKLSGLAKSQVLRSDFNLNIPNVPSVADVTDEVQLELQFVATAQ
jgi:polyisoprenoid-binding protein YceI